MKEIFFLPEKKPQQLFDEIKFFPYQFLMSQRDALLIKLIFETWILLVVLNSFSHSFILKLFINHLKTSQS